jgi:hypothetical protein
MRMEDTVNYDIPSDDSVESVPPQPKKKQSSKHGDSVRPAGDSVRPAPKPRGKIPIGRGKGSDLNH